MVSFQNDLWGGRPWNFTQKGSWHLSPKESQGHRVPHAPPSRLSTGAVGGLCAVLHPIHGGYLGTRQSGKHLIATLRRGM